MTPPGLSPALIALAIGLGLALAAGTIGGRRALLTTLLAAGLLVGLPLVWSTWITPADPDATWRQQCFADIRRLEGAIELYNLDHATAPIVITAGPVPLAELRQGGSLPPRIGCGEGLASLPGEPGTYTLIYAPPDPQAATLQPWHIRCSKHGHPTAPFHKPHAW